MANKRNTDAIVKMAKNKSNETREKVEKTITGLALEGKTINFNTVSKESGVSKSWLYSNQDVRDRIESIRGKQKTSPNGKLKASNQRTDASKDNIILTLKLKIKELENENKKLQEQIKVLYAKIYEKS